ncbi:hypothetical protein ACE38W_16040 [Chitinophaga sp. Hz27]|uniref:hypothetical protein n=1 Tax=Chitinophaga sp. Hz27 TaxID=3347169 RepID=UPI0035D624EE
MITNTPTKSDFEKISKQNLTQAFNLLFAVYQDFLNHDDEIIKEEVPIEDIWKYHHGTIRTSLILLHQAIEGLMKSVICDTSPLLLIDKPRKDWPSFPASDNKDFDSLYTIGGEALMATFYAVPTSINRDEKLIEYIEEIREKRNKAIHGTDIKDISAKYIIENILKTFTIWFGKDAWHKELKKNLLENPLFGYFDADYEIAISYEFLDFALLIIGKKSLSKYMSLDVNKRAYFCPECKNAVDRDYGTLESKWAFLNPNEPSSTQISCLNCHQTFNVKREDCNTNGCMGNVLCIDTEEMTCLTCFSKHENEEE